MLDNKDQNLILKSHQMAALLGSSDVLHKKIEVALVLKYLTFYIRQ